MKFCGCFKGIAVIAFCLVLFLSGCKSLMVLDTGTLSNTIKPYLYYYNAIQLRLSNQSDKAIPYLLKSLANDSTQSALYYELSLCYSNLAHNDRAIESIKTAIQLDDQNTFYKNYLGILLLTENRIEEALENQKLLVELKPYNLNYGINYAILLNQNSRFDESVEYLNKIKTTHGFVPKVSETLARMYIDMNQLDLANEELTLLFNMSQDNPLYHLYQSHINFKLGNDSLGFKNIFDAIDYSDNLNYPVIELYNRQIDLGLFKESLQTLETIYSRKDVNEFEKIQLFYPILFEKYFYKAFPLLLDELISMLTDQYPKSIPIAELSFEHYIRRNNFTISNSILKKLIQLEPQNHQHYERLVSLEYALENYENVILYSDSALMHFPYIQNFYLINAISHDLLNNMDLAIEIILKGTKNVKDSNELAELYGTLGDFYYKKGLINKSYQCYKKCLKHNPNNSRILNNYSYHLAVNRKKLKLALKMANKAVDLEPNNSTYLDTQGWVFFQLKKYNEAKEILKLAVSKDVSNSAVINEHYGDALYMVGNYDGAFVYWLKAKELGGGNEILERKIRTGKISF